jgi:6-phosphogluconolactonase
MRKIEIFSDTASVAAAAAEEFVRAASSSVGPFRVALSGGDTPKALFSLLADEAAPFRARVPWERLHFFWGDERCVPPDDDQSNYKLANDSLLSRVPIRREQVHRIPAELPDAAEAANRYEETIRSEFHGSPIFDWIFLGMGPDGHTASLFPGTEAVAETQKLVAANWVEEKETYRVTFTLPILNSAKSVLFLVAGPDKADMARKVLIEAPSAARPASLVLPSHGNVLWFLDKPAALRLKS